MPACLISPPSPSATTEPPRLRVRPPRTAVRAALVAVNLATVVGFLLSYSRHGVSFGPYRIDLDVYRIGSRVWLHGGGLYGRLPATQAGSRLPFTYPPIAAVLLSPLSLIPMAAAVTVLTLATIALTVLTLAVFLRALPGPPGPSPWTLAWLLPPALLLEPVRNTLMYGQINVVLMALVALDCLVGSPRWPRGALVGLAAAVKLTPAAFELFFLLRRDWRAAATAGMSFLAVTAAGFLLDWHDSVQYWGTTVYQVSRVGGVAYAGNQSILGMLARAGLSPHGPAGIMVWAALSAIVLAAACLGMRHALASSGTCLALSLNGFAALLISPVSWSHHWVWSAPALLTLAVAGLRYRSRPALAAAACGLLVFGASPQWWFRSGAGRELRWSAWQQVTGSSYVLYAGLLLLLAASGALTRRGVPGGWRSYGLRTQAVDGPGRGGPSAQSGLALRTGAGSARR